jgi:hypothetical protein
VGNPLAHADPTGLSIIRAIRNGARKAGQAIADALSGGEGASTAELQRLRDKNCADVKRNFETGKICEAEFEKWWKALDCGENIALTIIGGGAGGFGEGLVEAITDPHVILDAIGMIPVLGEVADGLNALLYYLEGDYVNAGISAAAMVPVVGILVTTGRTAGKAFKAIGKSEDVARFKGSAHYDTLDIQDWNIGKNRAWVQEGIDNNQRFYMATDPSLPDAFYRIDMNTGLRTPTVFLDEVMQLFDAGYRQHGRYLVPPSK